MNRKSNQILLLLLLAMVALWGCSDDDDSNPIVEATAFETLAATGTAYVNGGNCPGIISADALYTDLISADPEYTVYDIRAADAYEDGHIPGAINSSLQTILADVAGKALDTPIVVTCYTGQSAGWAKLALELKGYTHVKSLGFGMSSWNAAHYDGWSASVGNLLAAPETEGHNDELVAQTFPVLNGVTNANVLDTRLNALLNTSFSSRGIAYATYLGLTPAEQEQYVFVNYWGETDYTTLGHIPGAFQFTPGASLGIDQMLKYLPTDKKIVVYCWTGQTSSQIAGYLWMLGYDAYTLRYGANALMWDDLDAGHRWDVADDSNDYPLETDTTPFETLATIGEAYINGSNCPGIISADALFADQTSGDPQYTIIDIRSASDYNAGHIEGAINSSLATILDDVAGYQLDEHLVVTCYTGQSAGWAKLALELKGYSNVKSLGFGMSSWNRTSCDRWTAQVSDVLPSPEYTSNNASLTEHDFPVLSGVTNSDVLDVRLDALLTTSFGTRGFSYTTYLGLTPAEQAQYVFVNYWGETDYTTLGHIPGAFQFTPAASLGLEQMLANLPTDKKIVVYCWTGQTSSQIMGYLWLLGYDAYSLSFGANKLFHSALDAGHRWDEVDDSNDYPIVATPVYAAR